MLVRLDAHGLGKFRIRIREEPVAFRRVALELRLIGKRSAPVVEHIVVDRFDAQGLGKFRIRIREEPVSFRHAAL